MDLQQLANAIASLAKEELEKLAAYLESHEGNDLKVGLTANNDPIQPDPTHPHP